MVWAPVKRKGPDWPPSSLGKNHLQWQQPAAGRGQMRRSGPGKPRSAACLRHEDRQRIGRWASTPTKSRAKEKGTREPSAPAALLPLGPPRSLLRQALLSRPAWSTQAPYRGGRRAWDGDGAGNTDSGASLIMNNNSVLPRRAREKLLALPESYCLTR